MESQWKRDIFSYTSVCLLITLNVLLNSIHIEKSNKSLNSANFFHLGHETSVHSADLAICREKEKHETDIFLFGYVEMLYI